MKNNKICCKKYDFTDDDDGDSGCNDNGDYDGLV